MRDVTLRWLMSPEGKQLGPQVCCFNPKSIPMKLSLKFLAFSVPIGFICDLSF